MLGVNSVQFSLHQVGKVNLQDFLSRTLTARCILGLESVQFCLHQGREAELQHFLSRTLFGTHHIWGKERTVFFTAG